MRPNHDQNKPNQTAVITDSPAALQSLRISGSVGRAFPLPVVDGAGDEVTASARSGSAGRETGQRGQPGALPPPRERSFPARAIVSHRRSSITQAAALLVRYFRLCPSARRLMVFIFRFAVTSDRSSSRRPRKKGGERRHPAALHPHCSRAVLPGIEIDSSWDPWWETSGTGGETHDLNYFAEEKSKYYCFKYI